MTPELATRAHAQQLLAEFAPRMGRRYANGRNYDRGAGRHRDVSVLSPYIRRRMVSEREAVAVALDAHGLEGAEKFIQEVLWRSYFKGWLERRPTIWTSYKTGLDQDLAAVAMDRKLRKSVEVAMAGQTGIDCFDAWVEELSETGYLHNHARMWFASIWIFTLELPWRLGADFFYRHLLDGDPASNTCSWRWVAGLHTRGKTYQAQAWNIAKFTEGRFTPREVDLAPDAQGLEHLEPDGLPDVTPLRDFISPQAGVPTAVLLTEEDCSIDQTDLSGLDVVACTTLSSSSLRSPEPVAEGVAAFEAAALQDTAKRLGHAVEVMEPGLPADLAKWAASKGARQIAVPYACVGPLRDFFVEATPALAEREIGLTEWRRDWDALVWPLATAGFFKVKKKIPEILHKSGLL